MFPTLELGMNTISKVSAGKFAQAGLGSEMFPSVTWDIRGFERADGS